MTISVIIHMHRILFRRSLATFTKLRHDGSKINIEIRPSYAHKPKAVENLMKSLPELLSSDNSAPESGTWQLDESGDTIHRHVSMSKKDHIPSILQQIGDVADELKHDPHTHVDGTNLTISCTTHVPPGLSMKDVKLARRIDAILKRLAEEKGTTTTFTSALTFEQKQRAEKLNMEAISKAKDDCNCG